MKQIADDRGGRVRDYTKGMAQMRDNILKEYAGGSTSDPIKLEMLAVQLEQGLDLRILPLRSDTPMYLPSGARPVFPASGQVAKLLSVRVIPEYEVVRDFGRQ